LDDSEFPYKLGITAKAPNELGITKVASSPILSPTATPSKLEVF
jgi:hypothetical protein